MPTLDAGFEPIVQPTLVPTFGKWITKIQRPSDGDALFAASVIAGLDGLSARTNWLAWRTLDIRAGGAYFTAPITISGFWVFQDETDFYDLRCTSSSWPTLEPARSWERHSLRLRTTGREAADTSDLSANLPDAWLTNEGGYPAIETRPTTSTSRTHEIEMGDMPDGGTLVAVEITVIGVSAANPVVPAKYRVGRRKGTGAIDWVSPEVTASHTFANFTTELTSSVLSGGTHAVDKSYTYFVLVTHPSHAGVAGNPMRVRDVKYTGTATRLGL